MSEKLELPGQGEVKVPEAEQETAVATIERKEVSFSVGSGLVPTSMAGLWRVALMAFKSGMVPKDMRSPEQVAVAMAHGAEIGLSCMQACQSVAVINGRPSVWGDAALALVSGRPDCEDVMEDFEGEDGKDSWTAICIVKRKGRTPKRQTFSVADAKQAKLWGKAGPWTFYPRRMLQLRARAFALRDAFPDALSGIGIAEEVRDISPVTIEIEPAPQLMPAGNVDLKPPKQAESPEPEPAPEPKKEPKAKKPEPICRPPPPPDAEQPPNPWREPGSDDGESGLF